MDEIERVEGYESLKAIYEGENGAPWVAYLRAKEADGWGLHSAQVTKQISDTRFRGNVEFRRPLKPEPR